MPVPNSRVPAAKRRSGTSIGSAAAEQATGPLGSLDLTAHAAAAAAPVGCPHCRSGWCRTGSCRTGSCRTGSGRTGSCTTVVSTVLARHHEVGDSAMDEQTIIEELRALMIGTAP